MKVARTWTAALVLLFSLLAATAELSSADRRVSRRARRDRIFSRDAFRSLQQHAAWLLHQIHRCELPIFLRRPCWLLCQHNSNCSMTPAHLFATLLPAPHLQAYILATLLVRNGQPML